jgi:photosystem II stability/assembly factor-like uncharacterized protein
MSELETFRRAVVSLAVVALLCVACVLAPTLTAG